VRSGPLPPGDHTLVAVNADPTPGATVTEINLNLGYYKTLPGILKLVQLVRAGADPASTIWLLFFN
jgi:hypothetical protein